ncbi:MAG TPA: YggU family protein [Thermoplasmatales archaeon]|nr:YggU family protein [Thermoplasmatales archaeon]
MKIFKVTVIPNAKKNEVIMEEEKLKVYVNAPAKDGRANRVLIEILADFFNVKKRDVKIVSGEKSREKIVQIEI